IARRESQRAAVTPFVFHLNGSDVPYETWRNHFCRAAVRCGSGSFDENGKYDGIHIHDARRAFVTEMLESGVDPATTMRLSGHTGMTMLTRYQMDSPEALNRAIEKREHYNESRSNRKVFSLTERRVRKTRVREGSDQLRKVNAE